MAAKEIKSELKSARSAIQKKDYQAALKHCESVLKIDKTNYNALVFTGVASLELGKPDQAQAAYKKAIDVNAENILAWQGLASLFEKTKEFENKEDMVEVYQKLIDHYHSSDGKKWRDTIIKLADLQKMLKDIDRALQLLTMLTTSENETDKTSIWLKIISLTHENERTLSDRQRNELIRAYENLLYSDNCKANEETQLHYKNYISLLLKYKSDEDVLWKPDVLSEANRMRDLFPRNEYSLNVLARIFLENVQDVSEDEPAIYQELLEINSEAPRALLGVGKLKVFEKDLTQAMELLYKGLQDCPTSSAGWYFLSSAQLVRHKYADSEESARKGLSCLKKETIIGNTDDIYFNLSLCLAKTRRLLGNEKLSCAVKDFEEILKLRPNSTEALLELGRTYLRLNDLGSSKQCLKKCQELTDAVPMWLSLEGEILAAEGQYKEAEKSFLQVIKLQSDVAEHYLNLGKLYWRMEGVLRSDECSSYLLKAAKLDPFCSSSFLYLGHYYKVVAQDINKAHRCYKKAHDLNPLCHEAGEALGDACLSLGLQDEAVQLYKKFTTIGGVGRAKWAWLRLGLYYLKYEYHNESVNCFQSALRIDVKDPNSWECLGEAYMSRGSYTAALASFTRATELDPSLLYSRYQIAATKHLLGVFDEAVSMYQDILKEHCDYVPALKGLGETYSSCARSALSQDFHSRAVDYIQNSIITLARGIECHGNLSCLWKLLGDVCSLVFKIHEEKIRVKLPANLRRFLNVEMDNCFGKNEVLSLASSSYGQAVRYNPRCSGLWNDLGLSYLRLSSVHKDVAERQRLCERSIKALKHGLNLEPNNHSLWNALGIAAASKEINNPELSQHAFIQSIQSRKNVTAWSNLGVLYLLHGKADLANKSFNDAQCTDPSYNQAWIGQATIAEMFGHDESMDLYRHANELGSHVESYLGYAHWVCHTVLPTNTDQRSCITKGEPFADLSHLPSKYRSLVLTASVALSKYTDQIQDNACAYNMFGVLLEHQRLYSQAETAYARSLKLLASCDDLEKDYHNIVLANYARVLCTSCKYSESIEVYQNIDPLEKFYDITGLALAFFMDGRLPESYRAYEKAFELATDESQRSHIRAAMGMLGYALNDVTGCKRMLLESSQTESAGEQGLLALSALGLITSDITLAAAALTELVKVGQGGNESLIAEASYLFASYYALQGSPGVGKNYIVAEIHRRPHSSLLWNNLARFMLRFQRNKLKEAGKCAETAHRLGDRNVKGISAIYAYSAIGCGRSPVSTTIDGTKETLKNRKRHSGVCASEKAVHMQPDSLTSWALLAAAVADAMAGHEVNRGQIKSKSKLCEALTHFGLAKAIQASKTGTASSKMHERKRLQIVNPTQKWFALHFGYCFYYSGKLEEAAKHCEQALQIWHTDPEYVARIKLLLVEIDSSRDKSQESDVLNSIVEILATNQNICYTWLFAAAFHEQQGLITAAEYCYRQCLQLASKQGLRHGRVVALVRLAHLALRQDMKAHRWIHLFIQASEEVGKLAPDSYAVALLQGIYHHLQNHIRQAKDLFLSINDPHTSLGAVTSFYLVLLSLKKRGKDETVEDVLRKATSSVVCDTLQDLLLYSVATYVEGRQRKRLLLTCIHINPSEPRYWDALHKLQ